MSGPREWGLHGPEDEEYECAHCGETFWWSGRGKVKYCERHRIPHQRPKGVETECVCVVCGSTFMQVVRTTGRAKYCLKCRGNLEARERLILARVRQNKDRRNNASAIQIVESDREMVSRPANIDDNPYELIEEEFIRETTELLQEIGKQEIMSGASITEHHRPTFSAMRLEEAINNVPRAKIETMLVKLRAENRNKLRTLEQRRNHVERPGRRTGKTQQDNPPEACADRHEEAT